MIFAKKVCRINFFYTFAFQIIAKVAQLVERDLAKVEVASSNLVFRSKKSLTLNPSPKGEGLFLRVMDSQSGGFDAYRN
jgi:hypothetical protein